jgi:hypothetical protein
MKPSSDAVAFDWIKKSRDTALPPDQNGFRRWYVSHCLPKTFRSYVKIFHPIYEDVMVVDSSRTWDEAEKREELGCELLPGLPATLREKSTLVRSSSADAVKGDRVSWKELARRHGIIFRPELNPESFRRAFPSGSWPRYLLGPDEGRLDGDTCEGLAAVLEPFTVGHDSYFRLPEYWNVGEPNTIRLFLGKLAEANSFLYDPQYGFTPEYWWAPDKSWCVCTDWDLCFTLLGGSEEMTDACLSNSLLECVPVTSGTRIDYRADGLNLSM